MSCDQTPPHLCPPDRVHIGRMLSAVHELDLRTFAYAEATPGRQCHDHIAVIETIACNLLRSAQDERRRLADSQHRGA